MAMTLEQIKVGMNDKVFDKIVDIFYRESEILTLLPFDDCVAEGGGNSTLRYTYVRKVLPALAEFRKLYGEYTASEATVQQFVAQLAIMGGKIQLDRVLNKANGRFNNFAYQLEEHIKAVASLFNYTLINGDAVTTASGDHPEFEGLDSMVAGTTTEYNANGSIDLSTMAALKQNADEFYEKLTILAAETDADALLMNTKMISKIQTVARVLGYKTESEQAFGKKAISLDGLRFIDMKNHYTINNGHATANAVIPVATKTIGGSSVTGVTDIYGVKFDVNDGFHGITMNGSSVVESFLPNFSEPNPVKDAELELVAATVLKNTQHAGVLRNIKIA